MQLVIQGSLYIKFPRLFHPLFTLANCWRGQAGTPPPDVCGANMRNCGHPHHTVMRTRTNGICNPQRRSAKPVAYAHAYIRARVWAGRLIVVSLAALAGSSGAHAASLTSHTDRKKPHNQQTRVACAFLRLRDKKIISLECLFCAQRDLISQKAGKGRHRARF